MLAVSAECRACENGSDRYSVAKTTRGQSNLTKSASRGAHSPVRGHPMESKFVPLNSWGRVASSISVVGQRGGGDVAVIGTLAVDGCAVTFGTAQPSSARCGTVITFAS